MSRNVEFNERQIWSSKNEEPLKQDTVSKENETIQVNGEAISHEVTETSWNTNHNIWFK